MIIAANFKSNLTQTKTTQYLKQLSEFINKNNITDKVFVFPPQTALNQEKYPNIHTGAQNAFPAQNGAHTGEICFEQLQDCNIDSILIGHSERREIGECNDLLKRKLDFYMQKNMQIVFCIGESLEKKKEGEKQKEEFLKAQLSIINESYDKLTIAYEPIWAIGTGEVATADEINKTHSFLKSITKKPLLYGGSVKATNTKEILSIDGVDGVLVGGASLKIEEFCEMLTISNNLI